MQQYYKFIQPNFESCVSQQRHSCLSSLWLAYSAFIYYCFYKLSFAVINKSHVSIIIPLPMECISWAPSKKLKRATAIPGNRRLWNGLQFITTKNNF